eukprot:1158577-Pelagomonas_calceolata.AAC.1
MVGPSREEQRAMDDGWAGGLTQAWTCLLYAEFDCFARRHPKRSSVILTLHPLWEGLATAVSVLSMNYYATVRAQCKHDRGRDPPSTKSKGACHPLPPSPSPKAD